MTVWRTIRGFSRYEASEDGQIRRSPNDTLRARSRIKLGGLIKGRVMAFGYMRYELLDDTGRSRTVTALDPNYDPRSAQKFKLKEMKSDVAKEAESEGDRGGSAGGG